MKVTLLGVRGTSPVTEDRFRVFGGETTSVLIEGKGGEKVIIDAGTGIRAAGTILSGEERGRVLLLVTHYHLDHIFGFPSFAPLMKPGWEVEVTAPFHNGNSVGEVFSRLLAQPFWPIQVERVPCSLKFVDLPADLPEAARRYGGIEVSWVALTHPGGCWGYRLDEPATGASFFFATDLEWNLSGAARREEFLGLARRGGRLDLLVVDGQYDRVEYADKQGWGHNAWEDAVELAAETGAEKFLVTHHDPAAADAVLTAREERLAALAPAGRLARQGMERELS